MSTDSGPKHKHFHVRRIPRPCPICYAPVSTGVAPDTFRCSRHGIIQHCRKCRQLVNPMTGGCGCVAGRVQPQTQAKPKVAHNYSMSPEFAAERGAKGGRARAENPPALPPPTRSRGRKSRAKDPVHLAAAHGVCAFCGAPLHRSGRACKNHTKELHKARHRMQSHGLTFEQAVISLKENPGVTRPFKPRPKRSK